MGNRASRLGCLGEKKSHSGARARSQRVPSPPSAPRGPLPPRIIWAWWGPRAIQVTEVTETVVTETVVTEAMEVGFCCQEGQPVSPAPLDTLRSWLDGMEELQASQGPLAADATVAAAQLREQELLQRLLRERAPQVEPRLQEAGSPAELHTQWHCLVQRAEARWGLLERLVPAAQSFETACDTLLAQLSPGEKLLAELWQDQPGLSRVYLQHVCEAAAAHAKDLDRALETGQRLAELLTEDQAQLVIQQLEQLQERVRLTISGVARAQWKLLHAVGTESAEPSPPASLETHLDLEGPPSKHPGLKDQMQLSIQLTHLAERLEQLAQRAEAPGQAAVPTMSICEQCLSPAVLRAEMESLGGHWSEAQEQDSKLKAVWEPSAWGPAEWIWCGLAERTALEEGLQPAGSQIPALQEFPWGKQTLVVSWPWRGLALRGGVTCEGTCYLGLLMELLDCQAAKERLHTLEAMLMPVGHLMEELFTRSNRALVVQAQSWVLEELPGVLGAAGMKHWIGAPGEALALRGPDQGRPRDLGSRAQACLLGQSPEEMSWRPQWAETTLGSRSWMKSEPRERSQEDKDQCVQLEQGYPEQSLTASILAAGEQGRDGQVWPGCPWRKCGAIPKFTTNNQQQPYNMARAGDVEGTWTQVSRGRPKVQGASVSYGSLMVRVGGGWVALDEFLVKNDPGRGDDQGWGRSHVHNCQVQSVFVDFSGGAVCRGGEGKRLSQILCEGRQWEAWMGF
uniref:GAR domain-containing protein n=1 Tax=Castor canadensis TaxID=51338 RepID=A0A8C0XIV1_CASCN